jgi:aryl carrier-like protein
LDEFPKTNSGKLNRNKLPEVSLKNDDYQKPKTELEITLTKIVSNLLSIDKNHIHINDDLFYFGLNSMKAIQLSNLIRYNISSDINVNFNDILEEKTILKIANKIKKLNKKMVMTKEETVSENKFRKVRKYYPLTRQQYTHYKLSKHDHITKCLQFNENFGVYRLKDALLKTIELNYYIKTNFSFRNNKIYQRRNYTKNVDIKIHNKKIPDRIKGIFIKPYNITKDLLFRFELYYYKNEVYLLMDISHLIIDNMGFDLFIDDLIRIYNNENIVKKYDYFDYSLDRENERENGCPYLSFKETNDNFLPIEQYSKYRISNLDQIKTHELYMNSDLYDDFCKENNVLLSDLILASISLALSKFLKTNKILIFNHINGRNDPKYYDTVGYFAKMVPIFLNTSYDSIENYFNHLKNQVTSSFNQEFIGIDFKLSPMVRYNYISHYENNNFSFEDIEDNVKMEEVVADPKLSPNGFIFQIFPSDKGCRIFLVYNFAFNSDDEINSLFNHIQTFFKKIVDDKNMKKIP